MDSCSSAWDLISDSCPGPDMDLPVWALVLLLNHKFAWGHLADLDLLFYVWACRILHLHLDLQGSAGLRAPLQRCYVGRYDRFYAVEVVRYAYRRFTSCPCQNSSLSAALC